MLIVRTPVRVSFAGGGTDGWGHEVGAGIGHAKNVKLAISYFHNYAGFSEEKRTQYDRTQLDISVKF